MNFVNYDPETGKLISRGSVEVSTLEEVIAMGEPILHITDWPEDFDLRLYDVDLATKTLVRNGHTLEEFEPPPPPMPPLVISDRQFYQQAALDGYITREDALAAVQTGFVPAPLQTIVDAITDETERFNTQMLLSGATIFYRDHPLTNQIGSAFGKSPQEMDQFFLAAAAL